MGFTGGPLEQGIDLEELISSYRPGYSLPNPFYTDPAVFTEDLHKVFFRSWVFAGHVSQIAKPGDYIMLNLGSEPLLIVRGNDGVVNAMYNVCRHRGSIICDNESGHVKKLVCPYHQWVYDTDGSLLAARAMPEDFDKSQYGLERVHCEVLEGFIFVCLADEPPDFSTIVDVVKPFFLAHEFASAKICHTRIWDVNANWKLIIENSRECDHCVIGHPEYTKLMLPEGGRETPPELDAHISDRMRHYAQCGLPTKQAGDAWCFANRYPFARAGAQSESLDGKPVAPLMGRFHDRDAGVMAAIIQPTLMFEASSDYAVAMQFLPVGATHTRVRLDWLVHSDAVEGRDYDVERVIAFWKITGEQDWKLCEDNQRGVTSKSYEPGPYSPGESGVANFVRAYLDRLTD